MNEVLAAAAELFHALIPLIGIVGALSLGIGLMRVIVRETHKVVDGIDAVQRSLEEDEKLKKGNDAALSYDADYDYQENARHAHNDATGV